MSGSANPCGECQRNIAECPWLSSRGREPVPGWTAEAVTQRIGRQDAPTYHISSCPLYIAPRRAVIPESNPDPKRHREYTGFCAVCGAPLTGNQRKYCAACRKKYSGHV